MSEEKKSMAGQYAVSEIPEYKALHPVVSTNEVQEEDEINGDDPLPLYSEDKLASPEAISIAAARWKAGNAAQKLPLHEYPPHGDVEETDKDNEGARQIISSYFNAIANGSIELVASFWGSQLVTTETTNVSGETPLLAAVRAGHVHTVRYLLDLGADKDGFGVTATTSTRRGIRDGKEKKMYTRRTALQYAAETGNLPMVKLLVERGADDAIVAPDGQLALRLAATKGHREIVQFLPSRRRGGYKRWKVKHAQALYRCKKAGYKMYQFTKVLVWDTPIFIVYVIPKFFLWTVPKHAVVLPLVKGCKWLGEHWKEVPSIMAEVGNKALRQWKSFGGGMVKLLKELPSSIWELAKECAHLFKRLICWIWTVIRAMPSATRSVFFWFWSGIKRAGSAMGHVSQRVFSFLHTAIMATVSFFRRITLAHVLSAFADCLRAIFIDAPKTMWKWTCSLGEGLARAIRALFGSIGECVMALVRGCIWLVGYIPKKTWEMVQACGSSAKNGGREVMVWINPKRM